MSLKGKRLQQCNNKHNTNMHTHRCSVRKGRNACSRCLHVLQANCILGCLLARCHDSRVANLVAPCASFPSYESL